FLPEQTDGSYRSSHSYPEELEVWCIAPQHVVETHRRSTFTSAGQVEAFRLGLAIGTSSDGHFDPGKEIRQATAGVSLRSLARIAIKLLPHLVETMHRAGSVR